MSDTAVLTAAKAVPHIVEVLAVAGIIPSRVSVTASGTVELHASGDDASAAAFELSLPVRTVIGPIGGMVERYAGHFAGAHVLLFAPLREAVSA